MFSERIKQLAAFDKNEQVIYLESLNSDAISHFNRYYRQLNKIVIEIDDEQLNESFLILRNYFNSLRSTIIPFQQIATEEIYMDINRLFDRITQYREGEEIYNLLDSFGAVIGNIKSGVYENKLPEKIRERLVEDEKTAIINYYWALNLNSPFGKNTELVRLRKYLTTEKYYDKAIFIGSPSYYSASYELTNTIQKANKIYYISYDIYSSTISDKSVIEGNMPKFSKLFSEFSVLDNTKKYNIADIESDEYYDSIENSPVHNWVNHLVKKNKDNRDAIPSYVFELESERAIIYPENGSLYVVNDVDLEVKKVNSVNVKSTDWIIIKSSSESDYLDKKAAEIIGESYHNIYKKVISYKGKLLERLDKLGSLRALKTDLQLNKIPSTSQLLRNWIYGDTIAPESYVQILNYLNYEEKDIENQVIMVKNIISARQRAGMNMMKNINKLIHKFGEEQIMEEMDSNLLFEFEVPNTGQFIIETVRQRVSKKIDVEFKDLYKLHDMHSENQSDNLHVRKMYIK